MATQPIKAFYWMTGAVASFVAMAVAGREISAELNTFELMLYRSIIGFLIVLILLPLSKHGFAQVKTRHIGQHLTRNVLHFAAQNMWFYGIAVIPLSQLIALEFTNPIWVVLIAPLLLGEKLTRKKLLIAFLGFIGVLIVAQPGVQPLSWGHAAGLGAALGFALNNMMTSKIMRVDRVLTVLFWMTLMQMIFAFFLSLPNGIPVPSGPVSFWLFVVGICGLTAHYCLTMALSLAPASIVAPMDFIRLPIIAIVGMVFYAEPLMLPVFIGAGLIIAANLLNLSNKSKTMPP